MRLVWICVLLAGCSLYLDDHTSGMQPGGDGTCGPPPADAGVCSCSNGAWHCNSCPFGEGPGPIACSRPGQGCSLSTWEHDCDCTCNADGWWECARGTIGSICPEPPPPDAPPPDAALQAW